MRLNKKALKTWSRRVFLGAYIAFVTGVSLYVIILRVFPFSDEDIKNISYSKYICDKDGNLLRAFMTGDQRWLLPVELNKLNPNFINATIAVEDKRFWRHHGIDLAAVLRAVRLNVSGGRVISGASTLSMQVIRILENRPRTMFNKIIESAHVTRLEALYSKEEILELYIERGPYGGNIHGVRAASLRFFQKNPEDLSLAECALLAGLPQSPSRFRPDRYPERAGKRRNMVLLSMFKNNYITSGQYEGAIREPVIAGRYSFPFKAPHFTRLVKDKFSGEQDAITTIDSGIQHFAELALSDAVGRLKNRGVKNGAVVIIENATGKVRAMVGSPDFFSEEDLGQINGAISKRCPGSALKPFTYALGFDEGLYAPRTILADVPVQYSGYMPVDYDKKYRGPVTVREALVDSLNIPAVEVLNKITYRKLYLFLKDVGITTLKNPPEHYGLSLTLGSGDVNLLELTNAYAALARLGEYKPYTFIEADETPSLRAISEGAAYLVADILSDSSRLEAAGISGIYKGRDLYPKVAFKTGTSYGHRDAWTVCYNPEYTVGVWLGNFSAKPAKALVGIEAAAPVAARIFSWLYTEKAAPWYKMPDSIGQKYVCALSGQPVSEICPHAVKDLYIKDCTVARKCAVHKKIAIDNETGLALDDHSKKSRKYTQKVFEVWPPALQSWMRSRNADYVAPPEYLISSKQITDFDKNRPKIVSPSYGCEYFTSGLERKHQKLTLKANGAFDTDKLYWFVNNRFYGECDIGEKLFWSMEKGRQKITCADKHGRSSSVIIVVK